jgi:hypothetical protein
MSRNRSDHYLVSNSISNTEIERILTQTNGTEMSSCLSTRLLREIADYLLPRLKAHHEITALLKYLCVSTYCSIDLTIRYFLSLQELNKVACFGQKSEYLLVLLFELCALKYYFLGHGLSRRRGVITRNNLVTW